MVIYYKMFITIYNMFITLIFIAFMYIIYNNIHKNNISLAKSFILLMIFITIIKFMVMAIALYYNITLCDISKHIFCINNN